YVSRNCSCLIYRTWNESYRISTLWSKDEGHGLWIRRRRSTFAHSFGDGVWSTDYSVILLDADHFVCSFWCINTIETSIQGNSTSVCAFYDTRSFAYCNFSTRCQSYT